MTLPDLTHPPLAGVPMPRPVRARLVSAVASLALVLGALTGCSAIDSLTGADDPSATPSATPTAARRRTTPSSPATARSSRTWT